MLLPSFPGSLDKFWYQSRAKGSPSSSRDTGRQLFPCKKIYTSYYNADNTISQNGGRQSKRQHKEMRWLERSPSSPNLIPPVLCGSYRGNQPDSQTALLFPGQRALRSEALLGPIVRAWQALWDIYVPGLAGFSLSSSYSSIILISLMFSLLRKGQTRRHPCGPR